jgi:pilus assembly protein Flp/PilA
MRTGLLTLRRDDERGVSTVEYALLVGLIALVVIGIVGVLGLELAGLFVRACNEVAMATAVSCP